ncbi:MAG: WbqC family protein [Caulobacteraceae bacterium]|nr:WbqC family protein [Caulobacteraceae bacterium]
MTKTVVITQSNYLPWRGYFDLLRSADEVVLLDSVQYTRRDWRNRNRIKTASGLAWLTVPVEVKGRYHQAINETQVADFGWAESHRRTIDLAYRRAPHHVETMAWLDPLLASVAEQPMLSVINETLLQAICARLGLKVIFRRCQDILDAAAMREMDPTFRLAELASAVGAGRYLSGPAAKAYLDTQVFADRGIEVSWMSYAGYPEYPQQWGPFEPQVSVIDLMFNTGEAAPRFLVRSEPASAAASVDNPFTGGGIRTPSA